ncbi:hypothetical protein ABIA31_002413 [Catenulispora sp. MAP5-51]
MLTVTGVALLGACSSPAETSRPGSSSGEPEPAEHADPVRDRALAAEADLLSRYDAALALPSVTADHALSAKLTAIRAEHAAHAAAIKQGYTPPSAPVSSPAPSSPGATTWSPPATTDTKTAVTALAGAEQHAASDRTADILAADGTTAMLLASIAAAESGHAALLLGASA